LAFARRFTIGRDAQASGQQWGEADLARMKALSDIGLELSITGGITPADLPLFRDINVKAFIAGRALAERKTQRRLLANSMRKSTPSGEHSMRNHPLGIYEKALAKDLSGRNGWCWQKAAVLISSRCRWMKPMNVCRVSTGVRLSAHRW
jgi:hypothetical protein